MIRKDTKVFRDGTVKTYIRVVESYRPGSGKQARFAKYTADSGKSSSPSVF
jgi:hypothetical protein